MDEQNEGVEVLTEEENLEAEKTEDIAEQPAADDIAVADEAVTEESSDESQQEEQEENVADVEGETAAAEAVGSVGDLLVEGLSIESHVNKMVKYVKIPEKVAHYLLAFLYLAVGVLCIVIPEKIESVLPYIVGSGMAAVALVSFIFALITKEFRNTHTNKTAMSLILIGLSVMIILEHEWAHTFIPIVWGVLGLFEGGHAFNHAFSRISRGMRSSYYIIKGVIEVAVAFLLLYKPEEYGELHIIVFGVSLVIDGITTVPFIKNFITRR